jgi:hypothetical protein
MLRASESLTLRLAGAALLLCLALYATVVHRSTAARSNFGYIANPAATREFLGELEKPLFAQAAGEVIAQAKGQDTFLWRFADKAHRQVYGAPFGPWTQAIGDCTSFGWGMACYVALATDWVTGQVPEPPRLVSPEAIYGGSRCEARGVSFAGWSDGSYGAACARWCSGLKNGTGGVLFRQPYPGLVDLTTYSGQRAKDWGAYGCGGKSDGGQLDKLANEHPAMGVALIKNFDEARASLESGIPIAVCGSLGFSSTRDADGFAARSGSWAHCQCLIACRYADGPGKRDGVCVINSWGSSWQGGGKWPADQPDGSYWITREDCNALLSGNDSFAVAGVGGWRYRDLRHDQWMMELK